MMGFLCAYTHSTKSLSPSRLYQIFQQQTKESVWKSGGKKEKEEEERQWMAFSVTSTIYYRCFSVTSTVTGMDPDSCLRLQLLLLFLSSHKDEDKEVIGELMARS